MNVELLTNENTTFLNKINDSLKKCNEFYFCVSFIKNAGLNLLKNSIEEALRNGAKGKLITSTYQNFTDVTSLLYFLSLQNKYSNFEVHLDNKCYGENGFHVKGYIFKFDNSNEVIIGSSNITRFALERNVEWDVCVYNELEFTNKVIKEFNDIWNKTYVLDKDIISYYQSFLEYAIDKWDMDFLGDTSRIKPNLMQSKALKELSRYRDLGNNKALVVSATGSGKTILAALDVRNFNPKRLLFVVHRESILLKTLDTFKSIFNTKYSYGLYTGNEKSIDSDMMFATNITMSKNLDLFDEKDFDYIIMDECHHATAESYKKILKHFKPDFLLGLTATPNRMDNEDVFELFDNCVPFELSLREALIQGLITPFKYYGIRDDMIDFSDKNPNLIRELSNSIHTDFIKDEIEKKRPKGKLKAIAFCKSVEHARTLSEAMSTYGYSTVSLSGNSTTGERIKAFNDLQSDTESLEIIFTVDILNEGIDIPAINMVLFLRPTESQTIFLQQLGRGLRKYENKEYLTVLDFIGNNYQRSIQIALALGSLSDTNVDKPFLRELINTNFVSLDLPVEIHLDELSKIEMLKFLEKNSFNTKKILKSDYESFKKYLKVETYPTHLDYLTYDCAPNLDLFMKSSLSGKNRSYYNFLLKVEEENVPVFTTEEIDLINNISDLVPVVRIDELLIIELLLEGSKTLNDFQDYSVYNYRGTNDTIKNALYHLTKQKIIINTNDRYDLNVLKITENLEIYLLDLIKYSKDRYSRDFGDFDTKFKYLANYYKEQVMRVLLEESLMFMQGTKYLPNNEVCVFIGLKKDLKKEELYQYKDKFINPNTFQWESVNNTTIENAEGKKLIAAKKIHLFVRKVEVEDGITQPFKYFGEGVFTNRRESENAGTPTLMFDIKLDEAVPERYHLEFNIPSEDKE